MTKLNKKFLALLLAVMMVMSLAACGDKAPTEEVAESPVVESAAPEAADAEAPADAEAETPADADAEAPADTKEETPADAEAVKNLTITALVATHLDMKEGLRHYEEAGEILARRMPNYRPPAQNAGPEPINHEVFEDFESKAAAFADKRLSEQCCPQCGCALKGAKWVNQGDQRYMNIFSCPFSHSKLCKAFRRGVPLELLGIVFLRGGEYLQGLFIHRKYKRLASDGKMCYTLDIYRIGIRRQTINRGMGVKISREAVTVKPGFVPAKSENLPERRKSALCYTKSRGTRPNCKCCFDIRF